MKWFRVDNDSRVQPPQGSYSDWKEAVAEDCKRQCVYCCIHESSLGIDNFHVDHFRPAIKFVSLVNEITNLYFCCPICNRFKSDDWPAEPCDIYSIPCYVDPGKVDFSELITVSDGYFAIGKYPASAYFIARLFLNRPQLIRERRKHDVLARMDSVIDFVDSVLKMNELIDTPDVVRLLGEILVAQQKVLVAFRNLTKSPPYELKEIKRPKALEKRKSPGMGSRRIRNKKTEK